MLNGKKIKVALNRTTNGFIKTVFRLNHINITNAFKYYWCGVIEGLQLLLSAHFNLTVETPRGYRYVTAPAPWTIRTPNESKLKIKEIRNRYLFIVLYCWLERRLTCGDYHRTTRPAQTAGSI